MAHAILNIHVRPGSGRNEIAEIKPEYIKIRISAPADKGKANAELLKFLSKILKIQRTDIEIISGTNSKIKMIKINTLEKEQILKLLANETQKG
jgi:uncharacterized protein (TIGR00251 family)